MSAASSLEGSVTVHLTLSGGRVGTAQVAVHRPTDMAAALIGKTVSDALRLVPLLTSVCGMAQGVAALEACEAALGLNPHPAHRTARALLVQVETLASHAWQVFMEWPRLLGEPTAPQSLAPLRALTNVLPPALYPARDHLTPGGGALRPDRSALAATIDRLEALVADAVLGGAPLPPTPDALAAWADQGATPAARLLHRALRRPGFGASPVAPLPAHPAGWFAERLSADPGFSARPHDGGTPAFTGPLARAASRPLVAALLDRHGPGLAAHAAARLVELAELPARLRTLADALDAAGPATEHPAPGEGAGVVETARGRLAHWVRLADGRIAGHRTVAPTEWNFHPDGPLARALVGLPADEDLEENVRLLVSALDPCVAASVTIEPEA